MIKRFVIILNLYLLTIIIIGIVSCDNSTDCGPFPDKFKLTGITLILKESHNSDGDSFQYITNDSVVYSKFTITILPQTKSYYSSNINKPLFGIVNSAYACSPSRPPTTDEKIENIEIICNKDFDSSHSAGNNLADIFDIIIKDYHKFNYEKYDLIEFLSQNPVSTEPDIYLVLKAPPEKTGEFEFTIKYTQDGIDFDYFEKTTNKIVITKE